LEPGSPDELAHHGVKGMKWGIKRKRTTYNKSYAKNERARDDRNGRSPKRINKRINKGQDLETARKNEDKFKKRRKAAITTAVLAARYASPENRARLKLLINVVGGIAAHKIAERAETKRGEAFVRNSFAESHGLRGTPKVTKQKRGAYNISSL
jgi:hypothetical protein